MLTRSVTLAFCAVLTATALACSEQPASDTAEEETASTTSDLTSKEKLTELQQAVHLSTPSRLWVRCSVGRGKSRTTFDVVDHAPDSKLEVLARYYATDYNSQAMGESGMTEVIGSLGKATNANDDMYNLIFSFKIRNEPAVIDAFGQKGSFVRFRGNDFKAICQAYDF